MPNPAVALPILVLSACDASVGGVRGPDAAVWRLSGDPLLEIGVVEGDTNYQLHAVVSTIRLADGRIVAANAGTAELRMDDADGAFIRSVGRRGGGPGSSASSPGSTRTDRTRFSYSISPGTGSRCSTRRAGSPGWPRPMRAAVAHLAPYGSTPGENVEVEIVANSGVGWAAVAAHRRYPLVCGMGVGDRTPPGWSEGVAHCG